MRSPKTASRRAIRLRRLSLAATYAMLLAGAAIMVVPFAYSVLTSLKSPEQFASTDPLAFPAPVTGENYSALFSGDRDFTVPLAVTTVGQVVCSVLAAYAFARLRFPGRRALFWAYVATLMVPPIVTVIPLFSMLSQLGLRNTFAGLVAPFLLGSPYAIFLLRQNFQAIPQEVLDAATLDGAGHWRTLRSIVLPMNRPILAALTLITVVSQWNAFLWPSVIAPGRTWSVLTVATQALQEERSGNWTLVMAATTVALAPLVVLFLAFNRQIVAALGIGDVR